MEIFIVINTANQKFLRTLDFCFKIERPEASRLLKWNFHQKLLHIWWKTKYQPGFIQHFTFHKIEGSIFETTISEKSYHNTQVLQQLRSYFRIEITGLLFIIQVSVYTLKSYWLLIKEGWYFGTDWCWSFPVNFLEYHFQCYWPYSPSMSSNVMPCHMCVKRLFQDFNWFGLTWS